MSPTPQDDQFEWRETYFVLFEAARRPLLRQVQKAVRELGGHFQVKSAAADAAGHIETLNIVSPRDHSALEIEYASGDEVREQVSALKSEMRPGEGVDGGKLARLPKCDARFEIMHFEQMVEEMPGDDADEVFDPSALLVVLDALIELTDGVGVDPQSGTLM
ncbi:MAG: hypothetical protein WD847_20880 [Pirellulales bacterium]